MSSPFSKMDFLLILNFMENELKLKDETISLLKVILTFFYIFRINAYSV